MQSSKLTSTTLALSGVLTLGLGALSLGLWGWGVALGVLIGGALMIVNFQVLNWTVGRFLSGTGRGGAAGYLVVFFVKFALLAGVLSLALWSGKIHVLGLFLGCSVVVLAVLAIAPVLGVSGLSEEEEHGERN
jgi:ATP synthase I subunit